MISEKQENKAFISHYDREKFRDFVQKVDKAEFPLPISEFKELLRLLSQYSYVWYTHSFNSFHLVQVQQFIRNGIPPNARMVYRKDGKYMRIVPSVFSHQLIFWIDTTAEGICVLAVSDET